MKVFDIDVIDKNISQDTKELVNQNVLLTFNLSKIKFFINLISNIAFKSTCLVAFNFDVIIENIRENKVQKQQLLL